MSAMEPPRIGVGVFVFRPGNEAHFILGQRKGSHGAGTFALPGGHLEHGESFEQCAAREVKEETGLDVEEIRFLTATNTVFEDVGKHYVTIYMTAQCVAAGGGQQQEPQLLEPEKCEGWYWTLFAEMREMPSKGLELFLPLHSLMEQRGSVCSRLEQWNRPAKP